MVKIIEFSKMTEFEGRNGVGKCSGVELMQLQGEDIFHLSALTSKGVPARGDVEIPIADIPELIKVLNELTGKENFFEKMDWPLLRLQKQVILNMDDCTAVLINGKAISEREVLDGVINLIDAIQDYAVDVLKVPEETVFDETKETKPELTKDDLVFIFQALQDKIQDIKESPRTYTPEEEREAIEQLQENWYRDEPIPEEEQDVIDYFEDNGEDFYTMESMKVIGSDAPTKEEEPRKLRVVVDMEGGTIEAVKHDDPGISLHVIFTENIDQADSERDEIMITEDTILYTEMDSEADKEDVDFVFSKVEEESGQANETVDTPVVSTTPHEDITTTGGTAL
jgi:hypothetical protein